MVGEVNFVHVVNAEGPLLETLEETFVRLEETFGIKLAPNRENLSKIQNGEFDLGELTSVLQEAFAPTRMDMLGSWDKIESVLEEINGSEFRDRYKDSFGQPWLLNWFCADHVGFEINPRHRDLGYHNIFDRYKAIVERTPQARHDSLEWHFHPVSIKREAHRCATRCFGSDEIFQVLCRRLIDREFFPRCFHAGFQGVRPDLHWFLEQFIPFDFSNFSKVDYSEYDRSLAFKNGRAGDWRGAPHDWSIYKPAHDDHRIVGNCRRFIGRCLKIRNKIGNVTQLEVDRAFQRAASGKNTLLSVFSHDWRDIRPEIDHMYDLLSIGNKKYSNVKWKHVTSLQGFRNCADIEKPSGRLDLHVEVVANEEDVPFLRVEAVSGEVFGPQPFLAIKTKSGRYIHDNFDFDNSGRVWYFPFHADTLPLSDVKFIGVASNDYFGNQSLKVLKDLAY